MTPTVPYERGLHEVADASIIPILPRAHPMLTCALVGERLIDLW